MGFLSGRSARADVTWSPLDERWYGALGGMSDAGIAVDAQTILNCGAVLAAVRFKAESFGICTPKVYVEKPGNINEEDRLHYLHKLLRRPNKGQTGFSWRMHTAFNVILHGNSYNRIVAGDRSFVQELHQLEPEYMRVVDQRSDGSLVYEYRSAKPGKAAERLSQSEVLHFRGLSQNGYTGIVTYQVLRNIVGIALSAEKHASRFLKQGARIAGVLASKTTLPEEVRKRAEDGLRAQWGGAENEGKIALLGADFEFRAVSQDHQKSQFMELRDHQVEEVLRALGVPGVVVGYSKNLMGYASAEAFFEKGGIKHCLLPMVQNFEDEIDYALLLDSDQHYCKFSLATLLRASTKDEYDTLLKAAGRPLLTGNEARRILDMNPDPDPSMDKVLLPADMTTSTDDSSQFLDTREDNAPPSPVPPPPKPPPPADDGSQALARRFALVAAERLVRREIAAITGTKETRGAAVRFASNPDGWDAWVRSFYRAHAQLVAKTLGLSEHGATRYCDYQRDELEKGGVKVTETWERDRAPVLAEMALAEAKGIPFSAPPRFFVTTNISSPVSIANHPQAVKLPEQAAPVVHAPVTVNLPERPEQAPVVNVTVEPAAVTVPPAVVQANLHVPKDAIKVETTVKAEAPSGPSKMEIVSMPPLKIAQVPTTKTKVTKRTKTGGIDETRQEQE